MERPPAPASPPPPHDPTEPLAWETGRGLAAGFFDTLWQVILRPAVAFRARALADWRRPVLFAAAVTAVVTSVNLLGWPPAARATGPMQVVIMRGLGLAAAMPLVALFLSVMLRFVADSRAGFLPVLRVTAYAEAAALFTLVPQVGPLVQLVWSVYILSAGLTAALNLVYWRVLVSVILTFLLIAMAVSSTGYLGSLL